MKRERNNPKEQKVPLYNIETLSKAQNMIIKLFDDYSIFVSEARYKAAHGEELKIKTPKQMLQSLPVALAQVKPITHLKTC